MNVEPIRLKARILIPSTVVAILVLIAFAASMHWEEKVHTSEDFAFVVQSLEKYYKSELEQHTQKIGAVLQTLADDKAMHAALSRGDREALLSWAQPHFRRFKTEYNITHFYFHDTRRINLLRVHQPDRYGDSNNRFTAIAAEQTGSIASGLELGPLGTFTLRVVIPVKEGKQLLGYMELGEEVTPLMGHIQTAFDVKLFTAIDKRYLEQGDWEAGRRMLGRETAWNRFPDVVNVSQTSDLLPDSLVAIWAMKMDEMPLDSMVFPVKDRHYIAQLLPLQDAAGNEVGRITVMRDMTERIQDTTSMVRLLVSGTLVLVAVMLLSFYFILGRAERQLESAQHGLRKSRAYLANAQHMAHFGHWRWDIAHDTLSYSDEAARILGLPEGNHAVCYQQLLKLIHPADHADFLRFIEQTQADGETHDLDHRIVRPDGTEYLVHHRAEAVHDETGRVVSIHATIHDITDRQQAEMFSARLGRILSHSWNEIYVFDATTLQFVQVSDGACRNLGYSMDELRQLTPVDLKPEFTLEQFKSLIEPLCRHETQQVTFETNHRRKDGSTYPVEIRLQFSAAETPPVFIAVIQDISERKQYVARLERKAYYDELTGLPNRSLLLERLQQELQTADSQTKPLAIIVLGVRRLREVNDTLGHHNGDRVLQEVAARLKKELHEPEWVARLCGDEFAVVLPESDVEHAKLISGRIHEMFELPLSLEGSAFEIETVIGIALYPDHGNEAANLLQHADIAMRAAKREKSGFHVYTSEEDAYSLQRLSLLSELRQAIKEQTLALYYQPKVDTRKGVVVGVEALARWDHPVRGMVSPVEFIPMVEESGLIRPFTLWVVDEALKQHRRWAEADMVLCVAVNLSARSLLDPGLPDEIGRLLEANQVDPEYLILEITESAVMSNPEKANDILNRLSMLGIELSIDDYGTGYSSLAYLKKFPVDELKIDSSFVFGMLEDDNDAIIVRSTIELAHNLGLKVVAEGVENRESWDLLVTLRCDAVQGYFFSRPQSQEELTHWLINSPWGPNNKVKLTVV